MQGYHNRDEENKAVFTEDGGFRTGDLGYLDDEGFLYITGRIKEQYKLENGKYVVPGAARGAAQALSRSSLNVMVYGDNRLYNVALVVPDMEALEEVGRQSRASTPSQRRQAPRGRQGERAHHRPRSTSTPAPSRASSG
jgi:long-chain acyl-CoA synthetase